MKIAKKGSTERPTPGSNKLEEVCKEVADKVVAIENKAATAYYCDDDSIDTIEEGQDIVSLSGTNSIISSSTSKLSKKLINNINTNSSYSQSNDEKSVVSSITQKTILSKQSQTEARLDQVDMALS